MQTVFAEKTEDRSLDDNRHIGELFFIRMYWEKGRIPSGNILYWKDAKREDAQINFTGFDGLLLYLDETCEQNGVLLRKAQVRRCQKRRRYLETGNVPDMEQMKKSGHAAIFWLKVMGREDKKKLDGGENLLMNIANKILQNDFFVCKGL